MASRFLRLFRIASREPNVGDDVDQEIATHLAQLTEWLVAQGWERGTAQEEAKRRFGDIDRFRRELAAIDQSTVRRRHWTEHLDSLRHDVVIAWRGLRRSPGYAIIVIGTLGLALGANATMFGVVDRLLLRPPPGIAAPDEVKRIEAARWFEDHYTDAWDAVSYPSFEGVRDQTTAFAQVAAVTTSTLSFGVGADARPARTVFASGRYFDMLGTRPGLGRLFGEADDIAPSGSAVAVASDRFWRSALGADSAAVGTTVLLNGQPFQIVGVTPPRFNGTDLEAIDLWIPFQAVGPLVQGSGFEWRTGHGWQWLNLLVRLKPGVTETRAADDATRAYRLANTDFAPFEARAQLGFRSLAAYSDASGPERVAGWLYGVTLIVLLIACANIANVVLARGIVRRTETALRQALGISRARLVRQAIVETGMVVGLGVLLGLGLTRWGGLLVRRALLAGTAWDADPINGRVLLATALAGTLVAALASLWPLLRSARVDPATELHGAGRTTGRLGARSRAGLLLTQTTLSTALVVMAGLFLKSIATIRGLDLGIRPDDAYLVTIDLDGITASAEETQRVYRWATDRIRGLPGIAAAGVTFGAPFRANSGGRIEVPGRDSLPRLEGGGPYFFAIGPGTLSALGVRLLQGRDFTAADRIGSPPVALVSERMANTIWPGESALGRCFYPGRVTDSVPCLEIVGVVGDVHRQGLDEAAFFLYFSVLDQAKNPLAPHHIVVRTEPRSPNPAEAIRRALLAERPDLPYVPVQSYRDILDGQSRQWDLGASLLTVFGALSLAIAAIGLYGVMAFGISQRTREIGLRVALGAPPGRLLWGVIRGGIGIAALGVGLGSVVVLGAAGQLEDLLFRTRAADPVILGAAAVLVIAVSFGAAWLPGRRALRIQPTQALRAE
ncbi:MAG: ADOP family duplicated permease [Gemmatimonadales bacterium]